MSTAVCGLIQHLRAYLVRDTSGVVPCIIYSRSVRVCHLLKIKIHSSCEIEDSVETHLFKLCVILRSRVLLGVCPH